MQRSPRSSACRFCRWTTDSTRAHSRQESSLRRSRRRAPAAPPPSYPQPRRYGERYLHLLNNRVPTDAEVTAFECMQILQMDHGFNASTFTARVVASTLAPTASAIAAAMGALYGP